MGRAVIDAAAGRDDVRIIAAVDRADASGPEVLPGITATADLAAGFDACDVYVDFTTPGSTRAAAIAARTHNRPAVIGTTGLSPDEESAVEAIAERSAMPRRSRH